MFWGEFKQDFDFVKAEFQPPNLAVPKIVRYEMDTRRVRPTSQIFVGLDWEWCVVKKNLSFNLRVGYETQYFWSQILNTTEKIEESDLTFEGLTMMGRMDF